MAKKTEILLANEEYLRAVPLPQHEKSYTVISHGFIIDTLDQELEKKGLVVNKKEYISTEDGEIVRGILHIEYGNDPDMTMILTWINSYNKKVKFSCSVGGFIVDNKTPCIGTGGTNWVRKHTGTADHEAFEVMKHIVDGSKEIFDKILLEKETMKAMPLSVEDYGCIMGALYFEHEALTVTQSSIIIHEKKKPVNVYNDQGTLWWLYKVLMFGIREMTPGKWQPSQQVLHHLIMNQYAIAVDKNEVVSETKVYETDDEGNALVSARMETTDFSNEEHDKAIHKIAENMKEKDPETYKALGDLAEANARALVFGVENSGLNSEVAPERVKFAIDETEELEETLGEVQVMSPEEVKEKYGNQVEETEEPELSTKETFVKYMTENEGQSIHLIQYFVEEHYNDELSMQENIDAFRKWHEPKPKKIETQGSEDTKFEWEEEGVTTSEIPTLKDEFGNSLEEDLLKGSTIDTEVQKAFRDELILGTGALHISEEGNVKAVNPFSEEVVKAMSGMTSKVEIMTPEKALEKHSEAMSAEQIAMIEEQYGITPVKENGEPIVEPEPTVDLSSLEGTYTVEEMPAVLDKIQEKIDEAKEEGEDQEEEDPEFMHISELEGLTLPKEIKEQASSIEQRMMSLYGEIKPYHTTETKHQINVTIDSTGECFYVLK